MVTKTQAAQGAVLMGTALLTGYILRNGYQSYQKAQIAFNNFAKDLPARRWEQMAHFCAQNYRLGNVRDFVPVTAIDGAMPALPQMPLRAMPFGNWWHAIPEDLQKTTLAAAKEVGLKKAEAMAQISRGDFTRVAQALPPHPVTTVPPTMLKASGATAVGTMAFIVLNECGGRKKRYEEKW